jgi:hypothetical protein
MLEMDKRASLFDLITSGQKMKKSGRAKEGNQ